MSFAKIPLQLPLGLSALLLLLGGCATVADDYRIPDEAVEKRGYTSVAGAIDVGRKAAIGNAKTVSGDIRIGAESRTGNLSTVAGKIRLAAKVLVDGSVKTVAGDIEIAPGCVIVGDVGTVAGHIACTESIVKGRVTLAVGRLDITRSRIAGAVRVEPARDSDKDLAEVTIGPGSEVAELVVEPKARARVKIHRTAKVGSIKGIEPEYYD